MIRKLFMVPAVALVHFGLILALTYLGPWVVDKSVAAPGTMTSLFKTAVVWASRVLYFPVITLSLFPREMFPGGLVYVPILLNSFVWAIFICLAAAAINRFRG